MARLILDQKTSSIFHADALDLIEHLPDNSIQTVITSPTYWGKRKFSDDKREFGSESLKEYIEKNVNLYSKILKKLKDTGSLFIVIQDSYMGSGISRSHHNHWEKNKNPEYIRDGLSSQVQGNISSVTAKHSVIANKSLCAIPYRIAIKLVDQGYIWRQQIIWEKPNPMPENVKDRLRQSSEYNLHFVKSRIYKFNSSYLQIKGKNGKLRMMNQVWIATPEPKKGHTATFPTKIVEKLLLATSDEGDLVFEPFLGSGTMYDLSMKHKRCFIGADISLTLLLLFLKRAPPSGIQKLRDSEHRCAVAEDLAHTTVHGGRNTRCRLRVAHRHDDRVVVRDDHRDLAVGPGGENDVGGRALREAILRRGRRVGRYQTDPRGVASTSRCP